MILSDEEKKGSTMSMSEDRKIRKSLVGGFRKKDVVQYVEAITAEKEQNEQELRDRIVRLESEKEERAESTMDEMVADALEQNRILTARIDELIAELKQKESQLAEATVNNRKLEEEKAYAFATVASTQAELIRTRELAEKNAAVVSTADDGSKEVYSVDELLQEIRSYRMIAAALRENSRKLTDSLSRQLDFADKYIDSLSTVDGK